MNMEDDLAMIFLSAASTRAVHASALFSLLPLSFVSHLLDFGYLGISGRIYSFKI